MELISVNVGQVEAIRYAKRSDETGIYKHSVSEPVHITAAGLAGDAVCDTKNHGGPDQAVYVYTAPDYAWWSAALQWELEPGTFGENLTISDLESAGLNVGDRLYVGNVILQVTAARIPCVTLATRMGDPNFVKRFRAAERPGVYCRVLQPGAARAGDPVRLERYTGPTITILEMFRSFYDTNQDETSVRRHLAAPIAIRARRDQEERLDKLLEAKA
jgi:MOSC domain-containing protein YiiM